MTGDLRPYPEYKDTGLPWLGRIPKHWDIERLKWLATNVTEQGPVDDRSAPYIALEHVESWTGRVRSAHADMAAGIVKHFRPDDILFNKLRPYLAKVTRPQVAGVCVGEFLVLRQRDPRFSPSYYEHLLRSQPIIDVVNGSTFGAKMPRADWADVGSLPMPIPPWDEQKAIAAYLDAMSAKVRRFIRNRRRLIEVLNEQKQAIINRAVTRGLNPNAPLKPSGIDWLGDIPAHWEVVALRHLACKFRSGVTPRGGAAVYQEFGVPFLRSQNIHFDGLRLDSVARISRELHESLSATHVQPNDVLLNITGASIGRVCTVPENLIEGNVNQHVCIIRPHRNRIRAAFLAAYLSTGFMQHEIYVAQNGASREGLALDAIRAFKILVPPLEEQERILESITASTSGLIAACARAEREIDLIREYRTRLIADVVTGKVDVRGLALAEPPLDDEQIDEGIDDEEMLGDDESELVEETVDGEG